MTEEEITRQAFLKNKHTDDLVDHYWGAINYVSGMIKASEIKAGLILSFYGILLNFIYQGLSSVIDNITGSITFFILSGIWFICTATSIYYSIKCFMPKIEKTYDKNVFFFGDVISAFGDIHSFSKTFYRISVDADKLFDQLGQQIYINSKIAASKFKNVNRSLRYLGISLLILLLLLVYYFMSLYSVK
jgi:hypothetical protein